MDLRDLSNAEDGGTRISAIGGDPYLATLAVVINLEWLGEIIFEALHVRALSTLFEDVARVVALDNSSMPEIYYLSDNDRRDFMARLVQTTAQNLYEEFLGKYSKSKDETELRALAKHKVEDYFDSFWE